MNTHLDGKVVFITGAAGGIGRATALAFAAEGADLGLVDRNAPGLAAVADEARALGGTGKVETVSADLATPNGIQDSTATLLAAHGGRVGVLVCAAGILTLRCFDELTWEDWEAGFRLHCLSPVWTSKMVLPIMRRQGGGCVIFITSDLALQPESIDGPYEVAKGGLQTAVTSLARTEGVHGVRVNAVAPGPTDTRMLDGLKAKAAREYDLPPAQAILRLLRDRGQALGRLVHPAEVAAAIVSLASNEAITGTTVSVDGGTIRGRR